MLEVLHHEDGLSIFAASVLQCRTKPTCDLYWLTVGSMQSLGERLELAQGQRCPWVFRNCGHLSSCVHLKRHFKAIDTNGAVPHGGLVCTDAWMVFR